MSDSESGFTSSILCEPVKTKPRKPAAKRKATAIVSEDHTRQLMKKAATSFDIFNLQGEDEVVVNKKNPLTSVLYNRVANGQTRRVADITSGEFYVEVKVFNATDVASGGDDLWKKSLLWLKLRTDSDTPYWSSLQKFVKNAHKLFEDEEPVFFSNKLNARNT